MLTYIIGGFIAAGIGVAFSSAAQTPTTNPTRPNPSGGEFPIPPTTTGIPPAGSKRVVFRKVIRQKQDGTLEFESIIRDLSFSELDKVTPGLASYDWQTAKTLGLFSCGYQDTKTGKLFIAAPDIGATFADKTTCQTYNQFLKNGQIASQYLDPMSPLSIL